jgi:dienelactone hydrolase
MGERMSFKPSGSAVAGYLATPAGLGPAVIVIREWWGLVFHDGRPDVYDAAAAEGAWARTLAFFRRALNR